MCLLLIGQLSSMQQDFHTKRAPQRSKPECMQSCAEPQTRSRLVHQRAGRAAGH